MSEFRTGEDGTPTHLWILWWVVLLCNAVPAWFHWTQGIYELLEPFRYPWGLMPVMLLALHSFGEVSCYLLFWVALSGFIAKMRPRVGKFWLAGSTVLVLGFQAIYAAYLAFMLKGAIEEILRLGESPV